MGQAEQLKAMSQFSMGASVVAELLAEGTIASHVRGEVLEINAARTLMTVRQTDVKRGMEIRRNPNQVHPDHLGRRPEVRADSHPSTRQPVLLPDLQRHQPERRR